MRACVVDFENQAFLKHDSQHQHITALKLNTSN